MKSIFLTVFVIMLIMTACYYDNEEYLYPSVGSTCDTLNIGFASAISTLLNSKCLNCHSNTTAAAFGNSIKLEDYSDVKSREQDILGSIKHQPPYSPMPKGSGKLNACLIRQFELWVAAGGQNN